MQKKSYRNGMKFGKAAKAMVIFFSEIKHRMLVNAGQSKIRRNMANMVFIAMLIVLTGLISTILYYIVGIIGPILMLLLAFALPKVYSPSNNTSEDFYSFDDGYRDGPEGYGYYSGGYKTDD